MLRKFSKECIKIINEKKVNLSLKKLKLINFLIISQRNKDLYNKKVKKLFNQVKYVSNSGHYPMIDNPLKTYHIINKFIK